MGIAYLKGYMVRTMGPTIICSKPLGLNLWLHPCSNECERMWEKKLLNDCINAKGILFYRLLVASICFNTIIYNYWEFPLTLVVTKPRGGVSKDNINIFQYSPLGGALSSTLHYRWNSVGALLVALHFFCAESFLLGLKLVAVGFVTVLNIFS